MSIMYFSIFHLIIWLRCERNGTVEYILDDLSPNATNYCPRSTNTTITINEVHLTATSQIYIELWDMGVGYTELSKFDMSKSWMYLPQSKLSTVWLKLSCRLELNCSPKWAVSMLLLWWFNMTNILFHNCMCLHYINCSFL